MARRKESWWWDAVFQGSIFTFSLSREITICTQSNQLRERTDGIESIFSAEVWSDSLEGGKVFKQQQREKKNANPWDGRRGILLSHPVPRGPNYTFGGAPFPNSVLSCLKQKPEHLLDGKHLKMYPLDQIKLHNIYVLGLFKKVKLARWTLVKTVIAVLWGNPKSLKKKWD